MNKANTIAAIRSRDESTLYSSNLSLPANSFYTIQKVPSPTMSTPQGYRQPTRALRISNPDHDLIENDSSNDSSPIQTKKDDNNNSIDINQQQQPPLPRHFSAPLPSSSFSSSSSLHEHPPVTPPQPLKMKPLPMKPETIEEEEEEEEEIVTQKVAPKVPLKINTNYYQSKPLKIHSPSSEIAHQGITSCTENQEEPFGTYIPDRSTLVSPLPSNSSVMSGSNNTNDYALNKPKTSTNLATEFAHNQKNSKYSKVSYQLTNNPTIIKMYREAAEKTNDPETQLLFAKYLLETAALFTHHSSPTAVVVGSLWGISPTNKSTIPKPFHVVQIGELSSSQNSTTNTSDNGSGVNQTPLSNRFSIHSRSSTVNVQQASLQLTSPRFQNRNHQQDSLEKSTMLEEEGVKWIKKLSKQHEPEACYILGKWIAQESQGMKYNRQKLIFEYQVAAKGGIPEAKYELARLYEQDKLDPTMFLKLYVDSSNKGYVYSIFRLSIGTLFGEIGLRQSTIEALKFMHKAAEYSSEDFSEPCYIFGLMLLNEYPGSDIPFDQRQVYQGNEAAILYLDRASRLGNQKAQAKLGSIFEHGSFGETMHFAKAFDYYNSAALQGNPKAMLGLCRLNMRGSHGPRDTKEMERIEKDVSGWLAATPVDQDVAFEWCKRATDKGYSEALAMLGWFYESGFGTPRDMAMAEKCYGLAAESGNKGAKQRLIYNTSTTKQQHSHIQSNPESRVKSYRHKSMKKLKAFKCSCM